MGDTHRTTSMLYQNEDAAVSAADNVTSSLLERNQQQQQQQQQQLKEEELDTLSRRPLLINRPTNTAKISSDGTSRLNTSKSKPYISLTKLLREHSPIVYFVSRLFLLHVPVKQPNRTREMSINSASDLEQGHQHHINASTSQQFEDDSLEMRDATDMLSGKQSHKRRWAWCKCISQAIFSILGTIMFSTIHMSMWILWMYFFVWSNGPFYQNLFQKCLPDFNIFQAVVLPCDTVFLELKRLLYINRSFSKLLLRYKQSISVKSLTSSLNRLRPYIPKLQSDHIDGITLATANTKRNITYIGYYLVFVTMVVLYSVLKIYSLWGRPMHELFQQPDWYILIIHKVLEILFFYHYQAFFMTHVLILCFSVVEIINMKEKQIAAGLINGTRIHQCYELHETVMFCRKHFAKIWSKLCMPFTVIAFYYLVQFSFLGYAYFVEVMPTDDAYTQVTCMLAMCISVMLLGLMLYPGAYMSARIYQSQQKILHMLWKHQKDEFTLVTGLQYRHEMNKDQHQAFGSSASSLHQRNINVSSFSSVGSTPNRSHLLSQQQQQQIPSSQETQSLMASLLLLLNQDQCSGGELPVFHVMFNIRVNMTFIGLIFLIATVVLLLAIRTSAFFV